MDFLKIALAAFSATNLMTAFSYLLSYRYKRLFKEPVLLNWVLRGFHVRPRGKWSKIEGWLAHYMVGFLFVTSYQWLWVYGGVPFGWLSGFGLGAVSGIIGITGWHAMFRLRSGQPPVPLKDYYLQLFVAHIIFALVVVAVFRIFDYDPVSKASQALGVDLPHIT